MAHNMLQVIPCESGEPSTPTNVLLPSHHGTDDAIGMIPSCVYRPNCDCKIHPHAQHVSPNQEISNVHSASNDTPSQLSDTQVSIFSQA